MFFAARGRRYSVVAPLVLVATAIAVSGCNRVQAKSPGPTPVALAIPEPPPRFQIPVDPDPPLPPPQPTEKPAPAGAAASTVKPPKPTPTPTPNPTPTPPPASPPETPPPVVGTTDQAGLESRARTQLGDAKRNLARVNSKALGREARQQFDSANQFVKMTEQALGQKNFVYAAYCADKAATLAALLVKG